MNHRLFRAASAVLLSAVLCGAALTVTGCSGGSSRERNTVSVYTPYVPDSKIDDSVPGTVTASGIGETISYDSKISVTLSRVVELDTYSTTEHRTLIAELSITNNTDKALDCSWLTHFTALCNDAINDEIVHDVTAQIHARKYYTATQSTMEALYQAIEPGQSLSGYVCMTVPSAWRSLILRYIPYKYFNNDSVDFTIDESKLTHFTGSDFGCIPKTARKHLVYGQFSVYERFFRGFGSGSSGYIAVRSASRKSGLSVSSTSSISFAPGYGSSRGASGSIRQAASTGLTSSLSS